VLEVVDSPSDVATALAGTLRKGGAASVLVANRVAAVLARAIGGQLDLATALLGNPDGDEPASRAGSLRSPDALVGRGRDEPASRAGSLRSPDALVGRDTVRRRYDVESATDLLTKAGLAIDEVHGVRVVADLVPSGVAEREHEALTAFELAAASRAPFRDVATQLHLLARRG
jgi:hypothetical protein